MRDFMTEIVPGALFLTLLLLIWVRNELRWKEFKEATRKELDRMWSDRMEVNHQATVLSIVPGRSNGGTA